jgi:hypothetical protein
MFSSPKRISRNAERRRTVGDTAPQPAWMRCATLLCCMILVCVFCGTAFAQSAIPGIDLTPEFVGRLQPATASGGALPEAPGIRKPIDQPSPRLHSADHSADSLQPGDYGFVPLAAGQRASLFFRGYLASPASYLAMAASASANWIDGEPEGWGRTFGGYGKRAGTEFVLYTAQEAIHDAGDAALGLDPRYFACRCSGLLHRSGHVLKMTMLAYDGNGNLHLDLPRFAGDYGSSMLVTTLYPSAYSPLVQGVKMGHVQIGLDAGVNLMREFRPEIKRLARALKIANPATR